MKTEFSIKTGKGPVTVSGHVFGDFGIHRSPGVTGDRWAVTHIPSGFGLGGPTLAFAIARHIAQVLRAETPEAASLDFLRDSKSWTEKASFLIKFGRAGIKAQWGQRDPGFLVRAVTREEALRAFGDPVHCLEAWVSFEGDREMSFSRCEGETDWFCDSEWQNGLPVFCHGTGSRCVAKKQAIGDLRRALDEAATNNGF